MRQSLVRIGTVVVASASLLTSACVTKGTHEALLAAGGLYAKLHSLQFAKEAVEKSPAGAALHA